MKRTLVLCAAVFIVLGSTAGGATESFGPLDSEDLHYRVRRQEPLAFAKRPVSISAELEDTVIFECSAESNGGQPTLTWYKDGQRVTSSQTGIFLLANKNLLVLVSRDNLGTYTCQLELDGDVIRTDATLTLKSDEEKVGFLERPQNASVNFGERQVFRCKVAGDLQPSWLKDASSMFLDGQRVFQHRGDLHITSATVADTGRYTCQARNGQHTTEAHAWLAVNVDTELVCGRPVYKKGPEGFIVGGTEADPGTIPWQAMLWDVRPSRNRHFCGGALVNSQWVVTAAHCIVEAEVTKDDFIVRLGKQVARRGVLEANERSYTVQEVIVYEGFVHDTYDADLALIRLTERVLYTDYILPVCLPSVDRARRLIRPGSAGTVSGWGRVVEGGPYSNVLKKVLIPRVSQGRCRKAHPQYDVTRNMFCAGRPGGGEDACDGDSGGPFTVYDEDREYLLGVVSWGDGCALAGKFGVYTRLHKFFAWIQATVVEEDEQEDAGCANLDHRVDAIANGRVVIDSSATPAQARYFCDAGYRLDGTAVRVCELGGRWSEEPPRCTALQCPPVESPRNGVVRTARRQQGDMATYSCNSGYELKGPRSRVCQYGQWVGNEPRCEPIGCPVPNRPENGHVRFDTRTHGSLATYTCSAGHELAGAHMRECVNGQWTGSQPVCEKRAMLCPPVEAPANGAVQVSGRQTGDRARFTCAPGYEIKGPQSTLCQDGVWDGDEPTCAPQEGDFPRDCTDWYDQGQKDPGVYSIHPRGSDDILSAWCEFEDGGAWTVIQRRQDGSVDFFRNWLEYKDGFGDVAGEYWLGNENIYHLTNQGKYKLRIDLEDFEGRSFFAEYSHFRVEDEADDYRLRLGNHSGNIGDGMTKLDRDQPFTTKDHGARQGSHCANVQKTGWWFGQVCLNWANLNGIYKDSGEYTGEQNGIFWFPLRLIGYPKQHSLKKVTMKLRRLAEPGGTASGKDCATLYSQGKKNSGVHVIGDGVMAYCDMETSGGGWTVIQKRQDGSVNFDLERGWEEYRRGFGVAHTEYWLGNDNIYDLVGGQTTYKLRIDIEDWDGEKRYAEYGEFRISGPDDNYRLHLAEYSGTAGDAMLNSRKVSNNGLQFSTKDRDNDPNTVSNCAKQFTGAWWYSNCGSSNLNGRYYTEEPKTTVHGGIFWQPWKDRYYSFKKVEMKIRPASFPDAGEDLPTPTPGPEECTGQCGGSNCDLKSVGNPIDHKTSGFNQGAWMKDPTGDPDTIYYMNNYYVGSILVYRNLDDFKNDRLQKTIKVSACGTGHAVYNGNFYSTRYHSNTMFKMNLKTGATVEKVLPDAGSKNTYHYQGKALTDIDFAVDEKGLWVIYATPQNGGRIVVSRLNPEDLSITQTWNTTYTKQNAANAFMICGVLYTVVRQREVDYSFNTTTGEEGAPGLPFPTVTSDIRHLSYNPRERKLYAWRAGHQVTYDLEISGLPDRESVPKLCRGKVCKDCSDAFNYHKQDGVYTIEPEVGVSFQVYCRMVDGTGWTIIQRRKDGSENFFRTWDDYKNGFGSPGNEQWLGNEKIHALTKRGVYKLRVDLVDFQGNEGFAEYDLFYVAGEKDLYRLRLGQYSGTAKDSLGYHANLPFSTKDRDNDGFWSNCAANDKGGWWYDGCYASNLNGQWYPQESHTRHPDGLVWWQWPYWDNDYHFSLKSTEMRIQFQPDAQDTELYVDCDAVKRSGERGSGVFWIRPRGTVEPFPVYCDLQDGDATWTVIQQRNHTVGENFTRGWEDYKNGFGVISRDYWLGNDKIHQLTKDGDFRVKIQVQSFNGLRGSYEYDNFRVAGEDENYRLTLSGFTGRAGSCMERAGADLNGMAFSTIDRDNDKAGYSCAERLKGGWWYRSCSLLILNGVIKEYSGHDEYREVTGRGEGLYNVCLQQGPPVSLSLVTIKIQTRERPDVYRDCDHARSDGKTASGVYQIQPRGATEPFSAFCEMEPSGGGWTVVQRRTKQGTVNFTRGWEDYKRGFGDLEGELWLGLDNIFALTNQGQYALQIDFKSYTGVSGYTLYSSFKVAGESDHYRLHLGNRQRGISDCLNTRSTGKNVTGMAFTTFDRDHDLARYNCAEKHKGGWWFNSCSSVILNGVKKYWRTHDQYHQEVRKGLGLYNVCLQQGPPVSLSDVTMKISHIP